MANILYRGAVQTVPTSFDAVKASPLTNAEVDGNFKSIQLDLATKAPLASPALTGIPTAPTATLRTSSSQLATTAYVQNEFASVAITGGTINGASIGATTRSSGAFTTLAANNQVTLSGDIASVSTTSGTAVITGGLGVSGAVNIGGAVTAASFAGVGTSLTSLTAGNLTGTIPTGVLGNSSIYVGTTQIALNRTTGANMPLAGITTLGLAGSTSGTITLQTATAAAGTYTISFPSRTGTVITDADTGTVTSTMIADGTIVNADINASAAIAVSKLAANTISGISLGNSLNNVTFNTGGSGDASGTTYNGSTARTISYNTVGAAPSAGAGTITTVGTITSGTWSAGANTLTASNLTGTIPAAVLGNSTLYIGTTSVALNRASANQSLAGITDITMPGATSGSVKIIPAAAAGTGTVLTFPATTGTVITSGDSGTVTSAMIADGTIVNGDISASAAIAVSKLAANTISGVTLGNSLNSVTFNNGGSGSASGSTFNGSSAVTVSYNTLGAAPLASPSFTGLVTIPAATDSGQTIGLKLTQATALKSTLTGQVGLVEFDGANVYVIDNNSARKTFAYTDTAGAVNTANNLSGGAAGAMPYQSAASTTVFTAVGSAGQILKSNGSSAPTWMDLSGITTVGTIASGTWNGTAIGAAYGGTGQNSTGWNGIVKVTAGTWSTAVSGTDYVAPNYTFNLGTTSLALNRTSTAVALTGITSIDGSAAKWTTARTLAGNSVDGSANVAFANKFIVQGTTDTGLSGAQFLGALGTGLVKNTTTTGVLSIAVSGTDYAPATSGSAILKGNGSGGFSSATAGTDYLTPPSGTALLKANSGGALANAVAGTDYAPATSGSAILKGNGSGGFSSASAGSDYLAPPTGTSILKGNNGGALTNAAAGVDYIAPPSGTALLKANSGGALANATENSDYLAPNVNNTAVTNIKTATFNSQAANTGTTGAQTINWSNAQNYIQSGPTGSITYTFTAPPGPCHLQLIIASVATTQTITWPGSVVWLNAAYSMTSNKAAAVNFWYDGSSTYYAMFSTQV